MDFYEVVANVIDLLEREQRVSYRALKRQFGLDDDYIEDLKDELIKAKRLAVDEDGAVLVWTGDATEEPTPHASQTEQPTKDQERAPTSYTPQHLAEKILTSRRALEGERKQVTVMFADIKDSTELIRDLDPEEAQQLLDPAIHIMMDAVHRFEGTVNQVLGDGIMALFGAPIAHEDHAARACYAALAMQSAMQTHTTEVRQSHGLTLRIRVGLNAGEVVVRTIGNDLHMDYSAVGPTTHLAARMEQLADPGSIVLTVSTLRLVEGFVRVNALGAVPVKGMSEPIEAYELTGASTVRRRLQASVARGLTRFVGRDKEIEALTQVLARTQAGNGQIVAAVGEAGLGKSRLFYEFIHSHHTQGWRVLESASVSYGKATPYFPVVDLLKRYAHVEEGDDARTIRAKLTGQVLTLDEALQEITPALLALCDVLPDDHVFLQLDPPQRRQRTLDGLKRLLLRESQEQPLVLVFEDLHWIDSETQALLDQLVETLPTVSLLLLVNYRPEYRHEWANKTYYTQLRLDPLPPASADVFLQALLGVDPSLLPLKPLLIERTQGNPFFLEEMVRALVETEVLAGELGAYELVGQLPSIQVPDTVHAILAARIDRLPVDDKELLQSAAVIGTDIALPLLRVIADLPEDALQRGMAHLQAAGFVYETQLFPEREYTFKHALTHEVAYGSLLQERRRTLHAKIFKALETLSGNHLHDHLEALAHHAFRGEVWHKAVPYLHQLGKKALEQSANPEAVQGFEQALAALEHMPRHRETIEQAIDLLLDLRAALHLLREFTRVQDILQRAEHFAEELNDPPRLCRVLSVLSRAYVEIDRHRAMTYAQRAVSLATACEDVGLQVIANMFLGTFHFMQGNYEQAMARLSQNMDAIRGPCRYEQLGMAVPPSVTTCTFLTHCHAEVGAFAEAIAIAQEGRQIAEAIKQPGSLLRSIVGGGNLYLRKGDFQRAAAQLEQALAICQETGLHLFYDAIIVPLGFAYVNSGRVDEALPLLQHLIEQHAQIRTPWHALGLVYLSEAYLQIGRLQASNNTALQALDFARARQERGHEAWSLKLLGDIAMHRNPPDIDQAETHYQQALTLANELGMRPLQAHCHRGLGTLYRRTGQPEQARAELSTAIEMYQDMKMTFWLPETEAALADVEGKV